MSIGKVCRQVAEDELADWEDTDLSDYKRPSPTVDDPCKVAAQVAEATGVGLVWAGLLVRNAAGDTNPGTHDSQG